MITPDAKHGFNNNAYGRIKAGISSTDTYFQLSQGYISQFLPGWATGKNIYATFRGPAGVIEIIKIIDIFDHWLTVERGQEGTVAVSWPPGSLLVQRLTAGSLGRIMQKGEFRTVSYNPDAILAANYPGEKVYQDGGVACEKRWFINRANGGVDRWGPLAGDVCGWEYLDADGYLHIGPWTDRTDDTYWGCFANCSTWNGSYWSMSGVGLYLRTISVPIYWAGYRPTYICVNFEEAVTFKLTVYTGTDPYAPEGALVAELNYTPGDLLPLDWTGLTQDILKIYFWPNAGAQCHPNEIKFVGAY